MNRKLALTLAFWCSLLALRLQLALDGGLTGVAMLQKELLLGAFYDLTLSLLAVAVSRAALHLISPRWLARLLAGAALAGTWACMLASVLYFRFFRSKLDLWVIEHHWHELVTVKGSVFELSSVWTVLVGLVFLGVALSAFFGTGKLYNRRRIVTAGRFALAIVVVLLLRQSPSWFGRWTGSKDPMGPTRGAVFQVQPLYRWWEQVFGQDSSKNLSQMQLDALAEQARALHRLAPVARRPGASPSANRARLGLPKDGPLHVVLLVVESLRDWEFSHPTLGKQLFPALHSLTARHGLRFRQAYSSSLDVGQSARGVYSLNCSMLPNLGGIAPHIGFENSRQRCLAQELQDMGYRTIWMNGIERSFQNRYGFESRHGYSDFYDIEYFTSKGIQEPINLGIGDASFLEEARSLFEKHVTQAPEQPLLMMPLTLTTHHPPTRVPGIDLGMLEEKYAHSPPHLAHFSQLKYLDGAASKFIDRLFRGPHGERTLVVVLGDHSITFPAVEPLTTVQGRELYFRVPLLFLTKNMPKPSSEQGPVHQMDVPPTVLGLLKPDSEAPGEWLGRNLLSHTAGSPWLYVGDSGSFFRTGSQFCMRIRGTDEESRVLRCHRIAPGGDPLWDSVIEEPAGPSSIAAEKAAVQVAHATHALIEKDSLQSLRKRRDSGKLVGAEGFEPSNGGIKIR